MRKRRTKNKLLRLASAIVILTGLGTAAFLGWKIYSTEKEYQAGDEAYAVIAYIASSTEAVSEEPGEIPVPPVQEENVREIEENEVPIVNIEVVQEINKEITCWLYSPDTLIDYPICHGDDNEYYLTHLADGTYNRNGSLFVDCDNEFNFSDDNTLIYGHNMASGSMFASLINYADQSYYNAHPVMYLTVGAKIYRLEIFSGYTTTIDSNAYIMNWNSTNDFADWLREISGKSDFVPSSMTINTTDRIVTLSTCAYSFEDARYVVHGRLAEM
jgi:sortase B